MIIVATSSRHRKEAFGLLGMDFTIDPVKSPRNFRVGRPGRPILCGYCRGSRQRMSQGDMIGES